MNRTDKLRLTRARPLALLTLTVVALTYVMVASPASADLPVDELAFIPVADTYVDAAQPTTSYAGATGLWVDGDSVKQAFLRFDLRGLAGRSVQSVSLRMRQLDASPSGGRVHSMPSNTWSESVTYDTRPAFGDQIGAFGAVASGAFYEAPLTLAAPTDGLVSLALESPSPDGARWASRKYVQPPELIVRVTREPGLVIDGLSTVAGAYQGSSSPTYYPSHKHLAITAGGRQLAVHGLHSTGVQLTWRDPAGSWRRYTTGDVSEGLLLSGANTGDRPASIVTVRDAGGVERAWAVWSAAAAYSSTIVAGPVQMRELTDLDSVAGPTVGPLLTVAAPDMGNYRADVAFEQTPGGVRGIVSWVRRTGLSSYELVVSDFDPASPAPAFSTPTVLTTYTGTSFSTTIVTTSIGAQVVTRLANGRPTVFVHDPTGSTWTASAGGPYISFGSSVTAAATAGDEVVTVAEGDMTNHVVSVQRFAGGQPKAVEVKFSGYAQPTVASDGSSIWVAMVRQSDGFIVSRSFSPATGWTTQDRVEIGAEGGGGYQWPNLQREGDGRLRLVTGAAGAASNTSRVLAFQRPV